MSQEAVEVLRGVRIPLPPLSERAVQRRTLDERLFVRSPALFRSVARALVRLQPRSRLRRLALAYAIQRGYAALNRRDFDVILMRSDPEVEYRPGGNLVPPDLERVFYGHDGYRRLWRRWFDAFEDFRWEPKEILDFGDSGPIQRLLVTAELRGHGSGSGVAVSETSFQLFKVRDGLSISQEDFTDRDEALKAARLSEYAMSQENVETVRRWFDAFSSEDFDAAIALVHRDVVFVPPGDQAPYRGAESLRRWMEPDAFRDQVADPLETVAVTDTTILARQHVTGRGRASGMELDTITWSVWTFDEDGLITRIEIYLPHEKDRALEAAGISE